ncbi:hypothetical protein C7S15_4936 [Burkholderia cepacia]|nr:hypothetical protein [Burkholderia cepacia]
MDHRHRPRQAPGRHVPFVQPHVERFQPLRRQTRICHLGHAPAPLSTSVSTRRNPRPPRFGQRACPVQTF